MADRRSAGGVGSGGRPIPPGPAEPGRAPTGCGTHRQGHDPHHIQVRLCGQETDYDDMARSATVIRVDDDGWVEFEHDGGMHRRWNHQPERLRRALAESPPDLVEVSLRWRLLKVYQSDLSRALVFSLGAAPSPCRS